MIWWQKKISTPNHYGNGCHGMAIVYDGCPYLILYIAVTYIYIIYIVLVITGTSSTLYCPFT